MELSTTLKESSDPETFPDVFSICEICSNRSGLKSSTVSNSIVSSRNCSICFGLFDEEFLNEITRKIVERTEQSEFTDFEKFQCTLSAPIGNAIAERALELRMQNGQDAACGNGNITPINQTWRAMLSVKLKQLLTKSHCDVYNDSLEDNCICIDCCIREKDEDQKVLQFFELMDKPNYETRKIQRRKFQDKLFSKKSIKKLLENITDEKYFLKCVQQTNILSTINKLEIVSISVRRNSLHLAGRYLKFSRNLPQSPWNISDSSVVYSTSIEDEIIKPLIDFLKIERSSTTFSASGREDIDVRCLGNGRPFVIEIRNPKRISFDTNEIKTIENLVNSQTNLIQIKNFQTVPSNSLLNVKEGEESKTKTYMVYCISEKPLESLDNVNRMIGPEKSLVIQQKTPIRVLHRRTLQVRTKEILKVQAEFRNGFKDQFFLEVQCQAGTYVKEFVHGDFDRTVPSISSVLGCGVTVAALDVTAINIDWLLN